MNTDNVEKNANECGRVNLDFYKAIIENSPSGYAYQKIILDEFNIPCDFEFIEVNSAFYELTGFGDIDIIGKKMTEIVPVITKILRERIRDYGEVAISGVKKEMEYYSESFKRYFKVIVVSPEKYYFVCQFNDITDIHKAKNLLEIERDRLANIIEGTNVGTWEWNVQTGETVFNERWAEIIGYTLEEISPCGIETWTNFAHCEDLKKSEAQLKRIFDRELDYYDVECRMKHKDGNWVWVQDRGKVTSWTSEGKPLMMSGTHTDITVRKRTEEALRESEEIFNQFMTYSPVHIYIKDENLRLMKISKSFEDLLSTPISELLGKDSYELLPPDFAKSAIADDLKTLKEGIVVNSEEKLNDRIYSTIKFPIDRGPGKAKYLGGYTVDITKQKLVEEKLQKSEGRIREVLENSLDVSYNRNLLTNTYDYLSPRFEDISGYSPSEMNSLHAQTLMDLVHPEDLPEIERVIAGSTSGDIGMAYNVEYRFLHRAGHYSWFHDQFVVMKDECGQNVARIGSVRDITEKKQTELALIRAKNEAEAANAAKSNFLSNMSHEIRTPMNGFMGMIQIIEMSELTEEQREYLRIAKTSANALLFLINDILDYSKIEAGKMQIERINFSFGKMINDTISLFKLSAQNTGLVMEATIGQNVPDNCIGDPFRLRQIIANLLGNAIKFTKEGRIDISIKKIETLSDKEVKLEFAVKDTGIGIPLDKVDILFKRFSQVDATNIYAYGGSGLGLSICKGLVEKMGGEIWVESIMGEGSSFYFTCVLERAIVEIDFIEPVDVKQTEEQREISILLVEDDMVCRKVMNQFALIKGYKVTIAENGEKACDLFRQNRFDIVLMDVQMPIMNGYTATGIIREFESQEGMHTPIIAMTAFALKGDREKCLEAGMDDYLSKPIDVYEFYAMIEKWATVSET